MEQEKKAELWDVYDKDRVKTGKIHRRGEKLPDGQYHLVVHVCIFNSQNQMLIQQRQPFKEGWNNMWDLTVGGSAVAGDSSSQAAEREVYEELGLKIDLSGVRPDFSVTFPGGFDDYYLIRKDVELSELVLQETEVQRVKWAGKEEVLKMQEEGTFIPYWFLDRLFDMEQWYKQYRDEDAAVHFTYADERHLASWMSLVEVVRWNFPGLETEEKLAAYRETVEKSMRQGTAVCALFGNMVVGILLFSVKHNMLCCMAVHPDFRRRHIASRMAEMMLAKMDRERPVTVETFREEDERGAAPRAFYKKLGFEEGELCLFEESYPEQRFYLRKW
ncbi:MAG: GNAT family N-acetyltransferase [Acetatifactor sp.]|nr:GNAT family N-acetyltransferase [Acetatifactor sp.]